MRVILVLPRVPRPWQQQNLDVLRTVADDTPRVTLADWYDLSADHPDWFADDVRMTTTGVRQYTRLITQIASTPPS